ncbi:hypothetical protein NQ317_013571 [Molorchus minor]|uniref:Uncharacterized protein n=1 Tax=Molorchus minor TaxID=1323400 RepID=A0ABQ9JJB0_9CUCU|nr:hypothetical protein NQ317_013571 [Molorchus minor]
MNSSSDSEELFPIVNNEYLSSDGPIFHYDDPLLVSGVLRAVVEGDLEKVKCMIELGKSVNLNDNNGNTPLHVAVIKNNLEILTYLLSQDDVVVNIRNFRGETPLYQAVRSGSFDATRKLIDAGACVNLPDYEDVTPLHIAISHPELAHILIKYGAQIDALDYNGDTPLHDAISEECLETVCMLLYFSADANLCGGNNLTPFMKALIAENEPIQDAVFEYVNDFNAATSDHMTTLALALTHDTPYVEEIIKRGGNVNYADLYLDDEVTCAFTLCLRVPNSYNFKLIWDRLNYNYVRNSVNLYDLFTHLQKDHLKDYIDIIIESDNIFVAVDSFLKNNNYHIFINEFALRKLKLDQLTKLTCRLLLNGYRTTTYDIYAIFFHYSICELFRILLYMDNNYDHGWPPYMTFPRLIFNPELKLSNVMEDVISINKREVLSLVEYYVYPPLINFIMMEHRDDLDTMTKVHLLPKVPSLVEIARNEAREYIAKAFKTKDTCQFYTIVNHLNLSSTYTKILTFEKKLYDIKDA